MAIAPVPGCDATGKVEHKCVGAKIDAPLDPTYWSLLASAGAAGSPGLAGQDGHDGKSAYQIWLDNGHAGTEQEFLDSLKGPAGSGSGISSIDDLEGISCGTSGGTVHVDHDPNGLVTLVCPPPVGSTQTLHISMTSGFAAPPYFYARGTVSGSSQDSSVTIDCEVSGGTAHSCDVLIPYGETVTLTATSSTGSTIHLSGCAGDASGCTVTMDRNRDVFADFG